MYELCVCVRVCTLAFTTRVGSVVLFVACLGRFVGLVHVRFGVVLFVPLFLLSLLLPTVLVVFLSVVHLTLHVVCVARARAAGSSDVEFFIFILFFSFLADRQPALPFAADRGEKKKIKHRYVVLGFRMLMAFFDLPMK